MEHNYMPENQPHRKLPAFSVWALAFGCVIGWGCFVLPGTTYLPEAGPLGTILGIGAGTIMILIVTACYSILAGRFPDAPGSYGYAGLLLGNDYAFLTAWALVLSYLMLFWANATAFMLIGRNFFGNGLQWGLHYVVTGYDVYLGEVIATIIVEVLCALLLCASKKAVFYLRVIMGTVLFAGVVILFVLIAAKEGIHFPEPLYSAGDAKGLQILSIAILAPWMFIGYETVFHDTEKQKFSVRNIIPGAFASVIAGMLVYMFLAMIAASGTPEKGQSWTQYIASLGEYDGITGIPVFFNIQRVLGRGGLTLAALTAFCALSTGILGFYQSAAGLVQTLAGDHLLPSSLASETKGVPRKAILAILLISLPVPFLGRTSIGWLVDVSTLAVAVVYAQVSICAGRISREEGRPAGLLLGCLGCALSMGSFIFLLIPNIFSRNAMTAETYFMLALWSLTGIIYYWYIFRNDRQNRFGKSTIMWIMMLSLLFLAVILWISLDTQNRAPGLDAEGLSALLTRNSIIEVGLMIVMVLMVVTFFHTMLSREKVINLERLRAEESARAKSAFLFNMSHDIRTPMNAIIGYTTLAMQEKDTPPVIADYLRKIDTSGHHLLALINDILEMSRIESGKIELEPEPVDLTELFAEIRDMFATQMNKKRIGFTVDASNLQDPYVLCDKNRFNRILLNLLSNACKFTPEGGRVSLTFSQTGPAHEHSASYKLSVRDNGIGMSKEFAEKVFEAFERERTSAVNDIEGTGLGLAITRNLVLLMGGTIEVDSAPGEGTEFIVNVPFTLSDRESVESNKTSGSHPGEQTETDFSGFRLLLTDDNEVNREIAVTLLAAIGFTVETAVNGREAVDMVAASEAGYYDLILMDIQMPVMNGYEATRAIRALDDPSHSQIPVVAMTANAFAEDVLAAKEAGMNGHIAKPIDVENMIATLSEILI